ncbi:MAG: hypothetical protein ACO1TE_08755 [Prosthecobacter sp.]
MSSPHASRRLMLLLALLPACSQKMALRMDAVWERLDPMGHRKGHQVRYYPRANNPGMRMPENEEEEKLLKQARKESKYAVPMPELGVGGGAGAGSGSKATSPDGYALPGSSMAVPRE